jgi:hypothetical protein
MNFNKTGFTTMQSHETRISKGLATTGGYPHTTNNNSKLAFKGLTLAVTA